MKVRINKYDIIWNYLGILINLFGNFIILPFLLFFLDNNTYGLWNIFVSVGGVVTLFDFGFNVTFARNITYCWSGVTELSKETVGYSSDNSTDFYLMKIVISTCKRVYFFISSIALLLLLTVGMIYVVYISKDLNQITVIFAWVIYAIAIFLNLYYGYYDSFLRGVGAIADVNKLKVGSRLVHIIFVIISLYWGMGIIGASLGYLIYGLVFRIVAKHKFYSYKEIGQHLKKITDKVPADEIKKTFVVIWHNAWRDGMVQTADYLSNQVTVIIASFYLPLSTAGAYSLGVQLGQAIVTIAAASYSAYQPSLQSAYVRRDIERVKDIMSFILFCYVSVSILGFTGLFIVGIPIIDWINSGVVLYDELLLGIGLYQFVLKGRNCYTSYLASTNRIIYAKSFLVSGVITIVLAIFFEQYLCLEIRGIIYAQLFGQAIYNIWYWPIKVHSEIGLKVKEIIPRGLGEMKKIING